MEVRATREEASTSAESPRPVSAPVGYFRIERPEEIDRILCEAARSQETVAWTDHAGHSGTASLFDEDGIRLAVAEPMELSGPVRLAFLAHGVPLFVACVVVRNRVDAPISVWSAEHRAATRVAPSSALHIEWSTWDRGQLRTHRFSVVDISSVGVRTLHPVGTPLLPESPTPIALLGEDTVIPCLATRRTTSPTAHGLECGLSLSVADSIPIADVLQRALLPQLILRRHVPPADVIDLFERSGYLSLRPGCVPTEGWLGIDADSISRDLVYVSRRGRPVGHISITRAYRETWLGHQIATIADDEESLDARRALYLGFASLPTILDGTHSRVIGYYNRSRPWHRIFFEHFAHSVSSPEMATVCPFDRFERGSTPLALELPDAVEVTEATERELVSVAALARAQLPHIVSDAMDLHPARLRVDALHPAYLTSSLHRSRDVVVLRINGRMAGAALCEFASRELSLFNVMNMAQLFMSENIDPRAQRALHHHVRQRYLERGVENPLVVARPGTFDASADADVRLAETMGCIVWSAEGLRAYENYVQLHFAWLSQRKTSWLTGEIRR